MPLPTAGTRDCDSGFSQRIYDNWRSDIPWVAGATIAVNALVCPTVPNGYYYQATVGGVTAGSQPTWPTVINNTVVDGGVTWKCIAVGNQSAHGNGFSPNPLTGAASNVQSLAYAVAKAVVDEVAADVGSWTTFTAAGIYGANWANWADVNYYDPAYRISLDGCVELRGLAKNTNAASLLIATLPAGARPIKGHIFPTRTSGATSLEILLTSNGQLNINGTPVLNGWHTLAGIRFQAEQ